MSVSRNDPCPCGSGLKYKKCCLGKESEIKRQRRQNLRMAALAILAVTAGLYFAIGGGVASIFGFLGFAVLMGYILMVPEHH